MRTMILHCDLFLFFIFSFLSDKPQTAHCKLSPHHNNPTYTLSERDFCYLAVMRKHRGPPEWVPDADGVVCTCGWAVVGWSGLGCGRPVWAVVGRSGLWSAGLGCGDRVGETRCGWFCQCIVRREVWYHIIVFFFEVILMF